MSLPPTSQPHNQLDVQVRAAQLLATWEDCGRLDEYEQRDAIECLRRATAPRRPPRYVDWQEGTTSAPELGFPVPCHVLVDGIPYEAVRCMEDELGFADVVERSGKLTRAGRVGHRRVHGRVEIVEDKA